MNKLLVIVMNAGLFLFVQPAIAQSPRADSAASKDKIVTMVNADYDKAGGFKRMMLGKHYRKEWGTPVTFEVLNLDTTAGGLKPLKLGGGLQTKSLRLEGADGKEYVLRSINKDPSKALPPELTGTFANDIIQDQISSSNPYAPLAVAALAEAAGIFHTTPKIVYVPSSSRLDSFNTIFANTVCLFEERPSGNQEDNPAYGYSKNVVNSEKMLEKVFEDLDHRVDAKAYARARMFDMLIGDWDRHEDQWLWASFKKDGKTIYKPIPRDRDQAFAKLDGFIPTLATFPWAVRRVQHFGYKIKDIKGQNMNPMFLDRQFTSELTQQDWVEAAEEIQQRISDVAIEFAMTQLPPDIFAISGKTIIEKLKQRRKDLKTYAIRYYRFLAIEPDIVGSEKKDVFEVTRNSDSSIVTVYKAGKNADAGDLIFRRAFRNKETNEIRLYGLDGNDIFTITGDGNKPILVRIMGGTNKDTINNLSSNGPPKKSIRVYDEPENVIVSGHKMRMKLSYDSIKNTYQRRSYRYDWLAPVITPGYNPDDGVYIGGGITFKKQRFGKIPFGSMHTFKANYAFASGAYNFWYEGIFREALGRWDFNMSAALNAPNYVINYFGLGNETENTTDDLNYNRVRSNQLIIAPSISRQIGKYNSLNMGLTYLSVEVEESEGRFVSDSSSKLTSSDFETKYFGTAAIRYRFNKTDNFLYPRKGFAYNAVAEFTRNLQSSRHFATVSGDFSFYASVGALTLALRAGAATNIGDDYEFYQANTLGGTRNLRGYRRSRFGGETSFYNNSELRWKFESLHGYILRGHWGLLAFFDNGRVWMPDEDSKKWHYGYGGGIWFLPYNRIAFTATYGASEEDNIVTLRAGFLF